MDSLEKRAEKAEEAEDLQMALALWEELATKSQDPAFFVRYGRVAEKLKRWEEAENAFTKALRLDPTSSLIMENIGSLWANRTDNDESDSFQTARGWFLQALKYERHARLLTQLGATYLALDDNLAARDTFDEGGWPTFAAPRLRLPNPRALCEGGHDAAVSFHGFTLQADCATTTSTTPRTASSK